MGEITRLLRDASDGSSQALQSVFARLYDELHAIAVARAGRWVPGATLKVRSFTTWESPKETLSLSTEIAAFVMPATPGHG